MLLSLLAELVLLVAIIIIPAGILAHGQSGRSKPGRFFRLLAVGTALLLLVVPMAGYPLAVLFLVGLFLHTGVARGWDWRVVTLLGAAPLALAFALLYRTEQMGEALHEQVMQQWETLLLGRGGDPLMDLEEARQQFATLLDGVVLIAPALLLLLAVALALGGLVLGLWWARRRAGVPRIEVPPFPMWDIPNQLWVIPVGGVALLLAGWSPVVAVGWNLIAVAGAAYGVRGLAIAWYGFIVRGTHPIVRVVFLLFLFMLIWLGGVLVALLGFLETWIPFRANLAGAVRGNPDEEGT